jgi:hypothetical protein
MKSLKHGKGNSVSAENTTPSGIWLYVKEKEIFLSYKDYPYLKNQTLNSIQNVQHFMIIICIGLSWMLTWKSTTLKIQGNTP